MLWETQHCCQYHTQAWGALLLPPSLGDPPDAGTVIDMLTPETVANLSTLSPATAPVVEAAENRTSTYVTGTTPPCATARTDDTAPDVFAPAIPASSVAPNAVARDAPAQPPTETKVL